MNDYRLIASYQYSFWWRHSGRMDPPANTSACDPAPMKQQLADPIGASKSTRVLHRIVQMLFSVDSCSNTTEVDGMYSSLTDDA